MIASSAQVFRYRNTGDYGRAGKTVAYNSFHFRIDHEVFSPDQGSSFFLDSLSSANLGGRMLEVGTGCGYIGLSLLKQGQIESLQATDINPSAIACARQNSRSLGLSDKASFHQENVFPTVVSQRADVIFWNAPWVHLPSWHQHLKTMQYCFFDPGYGGLKKYISESATLLSKQGRLFLGFGSSGKKKLLAQIASDNGYHLHEKNIHSSRRFIFYELFRRKKLFPVIAPASL